MTQQPQNPTAYLEWSLRVDCPKCDQSNDLADPQHDTEHMIAVHIFGNAWDKLEDWEVECEHCGHKFTIQVAEY